MYKHLLMLLLNVISWCEKVNLEPIAYLGMQYNNNNNNHLKNIGLPL